MNTQSNPSQVRRSAIKTIALLSATLFFFLTAAPETRAQKIKVEIKTLKVIGAVRNEAMPGVKVEFGGDSTITTITDDGGRGSVNVESGSYFARVSGPCPVSSVSLIGSVRRVGGTDREPLLEFPQPSNQTPTVTFLMRCDTDLIPGMVRMKIGTTASCTDDPNGALKVQPGVTVRIGEKTYTSDEKGVIDVDLPPGKYPISAAWQDYAFGYVTQNGLKIRSPEGGQPTVNLSDKVETLEIRMFTCGADGQEMARAEITEIGGTIEVTRIKAAGKAFVGMKLRDGDLVRISGTAKLRWLSSSGTISFDDPRGYPVFVIGPDTKPSGNKPYKVPTFELLRGLGSFFFPKDDVDYDKDGNVIKFGASSHTIALIGIKGTKFSVAQDDTTQTTTITVKEGVVEITPRDPGVARFEVKAGQRAEVSPNGVVGPEPATAQDGPAVTPTKPVFSVNETIAIDYSDDKGTGWDWVVIVQPSKEKLAAGNFSAITPAYAFQLEPATNEMKPRSGRASFPGLPEGDYEARYISWAGARNNRGAGNNDITARASFKVGNAPPPVANPGSTAKPPPPTANPAKDLTGLWKNPGSDAVYRVRQVGSKLVWGLDAVSIGSYANMFQGQITGNTIDGVWEDLPGSPTIGGGRMLLKIESECRFTRVSSVNTYGADVWVKKDSLCDVMGITQRSNAAGAKPTQPTSTKPAGNTVKQTGPVVVIDDPSGVFEKPKTITQPSKPQTSAKPPTVTTVEVPEDNSTKVGANKPAPIDQETPDDDSSMKTAANRPARRANKPAPIDQETPEDNSGTKTAANTPSRRRTNPATTDQETPEDNSNRSSSTGNSGGNRSNSSGGSENNQAKKKPKKEKKPRDPNQPTQPTDTQQQPTQPTQQPSGGGCRGGAYWLGTPPPWRIGTQGAGIQIPWSTPIGATGAHIWLFRAGTNQYVTDGALPENPNACGLGYPIYPPAAGYYDAYLLLKDKTRVAGPVRVTVTQ